MKLKPFAHTHTPEDWDELTKWIQRHNKDRWSTLLTAACMAWNLACKLSQQKED